MHFHYLKPLFTVLKLQKKKHMNKILAEHRETTLNLMVQAAAQGLPNVPEAQMTDARKVTLRKLKCVRDEGVRLLEQAEAAAVQMYIKNNKSFVAASSASIQDGRHISNIVGL
jgi:hypothetical protein